jgi:hypothetical protein
MISPDAGNMGVKAIYIWAGMLVPTVAILYIYYPEVWSSSLFPSDSCKLIWVLIDLRPNLLGTRRAV